MQSWNTNQLKTCLGRHNSRLGQQYSFSLLAQAHDCFLSLDEVFKVNFCFLVRRGFSSAQRTFHVSSILPLATYAWRPLPVFPPRALPSQPILVCGFVWVMPTPFENLPTVRCYRVFSVPHLPVAIFWKTHFTSTSPSFPEFTLEEEINYA